MHGLVLSKCASENFGHPSTISFLGKGRVKSVMPYNSYLQLHSGCVRPALQTCSRAALPKLMRESGIVAGRPDLFRQSGPAQRDCTDRNNTDGVSAGARNIAPEPADATSCPAPGADLHPVAPGGSRLRHALRRGVWRDANSGSCRAALRLAGNCGTTFPKPKTPRFPKGFCWSE